MTSNRTPDQDARPAPPSTTGLGDIKPADFSLGILNSVPERRPVVITHVTGNIVVEQPHALSAHVPNRIEIALSPADRRRIGNHFKNQSRAAQSVQQADCRRLCVRGDVNVALTAGQHAGPNHVGLDRPGARLLLVRAVVIERQPDPGHLGQWQRLHVALAVVKRRPPEVHRGPQHHTLDLVSRVEGSDPGGCEMPPMLLVSRANCPLSAPLQNRCPTYALTDEAVNGQLNLPLPMQALKVGLVHRTDENRPDLHTAQHQKILPRPQRTKPNVAGTDGCSSFFRTAFKIKCREGRYVDIRHAGNVYTRYCHMLTRPNVEVGQQVTAGQPIGIVGSSGNSSGPHLHFEVHLGDQSSATAVDPTLFMTEAGVPLAQ